MKKYIAIALGLIAAATASAQKVGEWKNYKSYHNATKCVAGSGKVYTLCNGSIFSYNTSDTEVVTYDKVTGLTDDNISDIAYCSAQNALVIIYSNANIDLLYANDDVYNISDFKLKDISDKTINSVNVDGNIAYISTNNGLLLLDVANREFKNNYNFGEKVTSSCIFNNVIYTATPNGIYIGSTTQNLLDGSNWTKVTALQPKQFICYNNQLLYMFGDAVYTSDFSKKLITDSSNGLINANECNGKLWIVGSTNQFTLSANDDGSFTANAVKFPTNYVEYSNGMYWSAEGENGLVGYSYSDDAGLNIKVGSIIPDSPINNQTYRMTLTSSGLTIVSGKLPFSDGEYNNAANVMKLNSNGYWQNFEHGTDVSNKTGYRYVSATSVAEDPSDSKHCFVTATGYGVYEFYDGKLKTFYNGADSISTISSRFDDKYYIWTNGATYDSKGNLFFTNYLENSQNIKVLTSGGKWYSITSPAISNEQYTNNLLIDSNNLIWGTIYWNKPGVYCINYNNTIEDTSDDTCAYYENAYNQDGTKIELYTANYITEDKDGYIWVGTSVGPIVIKKPSGFITGGSNNSYQYTQIKIPRNDGTNYADYLLDNVNVTAIGIDGANRKWFGTENGVYLFSADCLEQIEHFTTDNSPLINNNINDIKISDDGVVYIATENGLVSYKTDATEAETELASSNIYAYPNPVKPDYTGSITIKGLTYESKVKIVNTAGQLMAEGTSQGGAFTWSGCNAAGERVASGVYFVLVGDSDLKNGASTKILVLK